MPPATSPGRQEIGDRPAGIPIRRCEQPPPGRSGVLAIANVPKPARAPRHPPDQPRRHSLPCGWRRSPLGRWRSPPTHHQFTRASSVCTGNGTFVPFPGYHILEQRMGPRRNTGVSVPDTSVWRAVDDTATSLPRVRSNGAERTTCRRWLLLHPLEAVPAARASRSASQPS